MLKYGYGGRILRINLSDRRYKIEPVEPAWIKPVIGGRGANTKRLLEELDTGCDPLGPDNLLIFGVGPLTGSLLTASAFFTVSAKSPLTGILGDSASGGQFGAEMKLNYIKRQPGLRPYRYGGGYGFKKFESGSGTGFKIFGNR